MAEEDLSAELRTAFLERSAQELPDSACFVPMAQPRKRTNEAPDKRLILTTREYILAMTTGRSRAQRPAWEEKAESHDWLGDGGLVLRETSPSLGALTVSFDANEITLFFGERGYHLHFTAYADDWPDDEWPTEGARQVAADAVDLTRRLLRDELVFRSGILATGVHPNRRSLLRRLTPWVHESLCSGRPPMR